MPKITIPYNYTPRDYQLPFLRAMDNGVRNAIQVWHRRTGKDKTDLNFTIKEMMKRVGNYFYVYPTYAQGKKAMWDNIGKDGFPFLGHFPKEILAGPPNQTEMKIKVKNGSQFQIIGSDSIDTVMGTNPAGIVYSEFSLQDPSAADYMSPILLENGGWQVYNFTPRGKNHAYDLYENVKNNPKWFTQILTVDDTGGIITEEMLQSERDRGVSEEHIRQEYYCDFNGPMEGAVYGAEMRAIQSEGRVCRVPYDPALLVDTWWDIGVGDATAIWFTQTSFTDVRVIDYQEDNGKSMDHYARFIKSKPYAYGSHNGPHDMNQRQKNTAKTLADYAKNLGLNFNVCKRESVETGVNAVRMFLRKCVFDEKCRKGIDGLNAYKYQWDAKKEMYSTKPYHNWASNPADAFRTLAMNHREARVAPKQERPRRQATNWMSS